MTFVELVEALSLESGKPKNEVSALLKTAIKVIEKTAISGQPVILPGLGKFTQKVSKPRMAFGKMTKEKIGIKFTPYESVFVKGES